MKPEIKRFLETDYRQILEHPGMSVDMKTGYLLAVVNIIPAAAGMAYMPLGTAGAVIREFVVEYLRANQ